MAFRKTFSALRSSALVLTFFVLPLLGGCAQESARNESDHYSVEWVVSQATDAAETYTVEITVVDLSSGEVVAHPRLYARWGEPAEITQSNPGSDGELTARVFVDAAGSRAEYGLDMTKAGRKVLSHSAEVSLGGAAPARLGG